MSRNSRMFIGGSKDGEVIDVDRDVVRIPVRNTDLRFLPVHDWFEFIDETYREFEFDDFGTRYAVMVCDSVSKGTIFENLVKHYRPKFDPCEVLQQLLDTVSERIEKLREAQKRSIDVRCISEEIEARGRELNAVAIQITMLMDKFRREDSINHNVAASPVKEER